jgi:hypothetical protein
MAKALFIAGTGKDVGKTSTSLALIHLFQKKYERIGYIKPISQRFVPVADQKVGDDPVLIKQVFHLPSDLSAMSPIVVDGDFTEKIINGEIKRSFSRNILTAFQKIEQESDLIIVEGAGHAGVGAVINQSNADTARLLNADVLLVGGGGIGRAIDKMLLDKAFFEAQGVRVIGVIINKVFQRKYEKVAPLLKKWFKRERIPLFGILPYQSALSWPDLLLIRKATRSEVICSDKRHDIKIERTVIAAKGIDRVLDDLRRSEKGTLLIVPIDRTDLLFFLVSPYFQKMACSRNIAGVLLSGDPESRADIEEIFKDFGAPVFMSSSSAYDLATTIHDLKPKMLLRDESNIAMIKDLSEQFIDIDHLYKHVNAPKDVPERTFLQSLWMFLQDLTGRCMAAIRRVVHRLIK